MIKQGHFRTAFAGLILALLLSACSGNYHLTKSRVSYLNMVDSSSDASSSLVSLIAPYKQKIDSQMSIPLVRVEVELQKAQPEGTLGNMVADVLMAYSVRTKGFEANFCVLNHGGLRLPVIYPGEITRGMVFELMPFENELVALRMKGSDCRELFQVILAQNGAPVSGLKLKGNAKKLIEAKIKNTPLDDNASYWVITSDYLANGGDNMSVFKKAQERYSLEVKLRDALMTELGTMGQLGVPVYSIKEGRITIEN